MPRGFQGVRGASATATARNEAYKSRVFTPFFSIQSGQTAVVRFLEEGDDIHWAHAHAVQAPNRQYPDWYASRNQTEDLAGGPACPLVEAGLKRGFRGWINVIWRDAPSYRRDNDGKLVKPKEVVGTEDQVAIWEGGITLFNKLAEVDARFKGLSSRDFEIKKTGTGVTTAYEVWPVDMEGGAKPMSDADKELAASKPDLSKKSVPLSYDALKALITGGRDAMQAVESAETAANTSPFARNAEQAVKKNPFS